MRLNGRLINSSFSKLKIEKTSDVRLIKRAYTSLAKTMNPEEDPEAFSELHKAYKIALKYAQTDDTVFEDGLVIEHRPEPVADKEETESTPEDGFDFTGVSVDEVQSSSSEAIIDDIVEYREANGLDEEERLEGALPDYIHRHADALFLMYNELFRRSCDPSVWQLFTEEPVIRIGIKDPRFREFLRASVPMDSPDYKALDEFCSEAEEIWKKESEEAREQLDELQVVYKKCEKLTHIQVAGFITAIVPCVIVIVIAEFAGLDFNLPELIVMVVLSVFSVIGIILTECTHYKLRRFAKDYNIMSQSLLDKLERV